MSIAVALLAIGEVPVARLALVALASVGVGLAVTLAGGQVTFTVFRADAVAVARLAAVLRESVRAWCATVTLTSDDIGLAPAESSVLVALLA